METQNELIHAATFVVIGGGIAGVSCAETIASCCPEKRILLVTESSVIKTIVNLTPVARYAYKFDIVERPIEQSSFKNGSILAICDTLRSIEVLAKRIHLQSGKIYCYEYLCLCTGATPRLCTPCNSRVLSIRDTASALQLQQQIQSAKSIVLVGNGGIATEVAYKLENVKVHWVIKDDHISAPFVDEGAAAFLQLSMNSAKVELDSGHVKRLRYAELVLTRNQSGGPRGGGALGPDWHTDFCLRGLSKNAKSLVMHYQCEVQQVLHREQYVSVKLSSGENIDCDFLISATGVVPCHDYLCDRPFDISPVDGGIMVNEFMMTNNPAIYAAGDVCSANWKKNKHWFQMRLWTQARQTGNMAGRSMVAALRGEDILSDFCFEIFTHVTRLFGHEIVLLGCYNAQGLGNAYEILVRSTPRKEYIKLVLQNGRLCGAMLIGDTELAETCENLILNEIDLTDLADDILNPDIDIADYFD